jgi:peptidoglycan/LPS O-acetylase OafA/YrhL
LTKLSHLQSLRGILALWIFICHSFAFALRGQEFGIISKILYFLPSGAQTVNTFIILSGFVIALVLVEKKESLKQFYISRLCRIYPVYIIVLVVAFLLFPYMISGVLKVLPWGGSTAYYADLIAKSESSQSKEWFIFLLQLLNIQGIVPYSLIPFASGAILPVAWSISLECQFYVVAPLLIKSSRMNNWFRWSLILFIGLFSLALTNFNSWGFNKAFLLMSFKYFMFGILSYFVYRFVRQNRLSLTILQVFSILVLILLLFGKIWAVLIWVFFMLFSFMGRGKIEDIIRKFVEFRILVFLGDISYSIYLWHILVLWVIPRILFKLSINSPEVHAFIYIFFGGPLVIIISYLSYVLIEKPFIKYGKITNEVIQN